MSDKYHFSPVTQKVSLCTAVKKACRYGNHFSDPASAQNFADNHHIQELNKKIIGTLNPPIDVPDSDLKEPDFNYIEYYSIGVEWEDDESSSYINDFENYRDDDESNYKRHNPVVSSINLPEILSTIFKVGENQIPENITKVCLQNGWDEKYAWSAVTEPNYYEDDVTIVPPSNMEQVLREEYFKLDNAVDKDGILKYCRSKGFGTAGKNPLQAIKEQLDHENNGRKSKAVDNAKKVSVSRIRLSDIKISAPAHYANVEPRKPESKLNIKKSETFAGVVTKNSRGVYSLVDGYHRMKHLKDVTKNTYANFIILE